VPNILCLLLPISIGYDNCWGIMLVGGAGEEGLAKGLYKKILNERTEEGYRRAIHPMVRGQRDESHAANTTRAGETDLGLRGATLGADVLEAMGFSPWRQVHGRASIADFFKPAGGAVSTSCASPTSNPVVLSRES
jgi:hypothetical protein